MGRGGSEEAAPSSPPSDAKLFQEKSLLGWCSPAKVRADGAFSSKPTDVGVVSLSCLSSSVLKF